MYYKSQIPEIQTAIKDFFFLISEIDTSGLTLQDKVYFFPGFNVISVKQLEGLLLRIYGPKW